MRKSEKKVAEIARRGGGGSFEECSKFQVFNLLSIVLFRCMVNWLAWGVQLSNSPVIVFYFGPRQFNAKHFDCDIFTFISTNAFVKVLSNIHTSYNANNRMRVMMKPGDMAVLGDEAPEWRRE